MLKAKILIILLLLSWILTGALVYLHKDRVQLVKLPPESLAQWYKPQNKRQIWLHNMFKLRREMQAVEHYASLKQAEPLALWTGRLNEHYQEITEMVPEWGGRLDQTAIEDLVKFQQTGQFGRIGDGLKYLRQSCDACHDQFRAVTAVLYRAPDFSALQLNDSNLLSESMQALIAEVNSIKIAIEAEDQAQALSSLSELRIGMDEMDVLCDSCHKFSPKSYPDAAMNTALDELQSKLLSGTLKQKGRALGELAVTACAQCHGTHRIGSDVRQKLSEKPELLELLRH